jgi:hypothetical protein
MHVVLAVCTSTPNVSHRQSTCQFSQPCMCLRLSTDQVQQYHINPPQRPHTMVPPLRVSPPRFTVNDSYPEPYFISSPPCEVAALSGCASCARATAGGVAYQLEPGSACDGTRCTSLGLASDVTVATLSSPDGVSLTFGGGDDGREFVYVAHSRLACSCSTPSPHALKLHSIAWCVVAGGQPSFGPASHA